MKLEIRLKDDEVLSSAKALDIANQVMRAAADMLEDADEDITYTGSETYWLCVDRLDAFNRKIPGEFKLKQIRSGVYQLHLRAESLTRTLAGKDLDADVKRTQEHVRKERAGQPMEDIYNVHEIAAAKERVRYYLKQKASLFWERYGLRMSDVHERAVEILEVPMHEWNLLHWRRYQTAVNRLDKAWFGEPTDTEVTDGE